METSTPYPSLQSCLEPQLPLQSLPLRSPPAIPAVGGAGMRTRLPTSHYCPIVGGRAEVGYPGIRGLLGTALSPGNLSSPMTCQAQHVLLTQPYNSSGVGPLSFLPMLQIR